MYCHSICGSGREDHTRLHQTHGNDHRDQEAQCFHFSSHFFQRSDKFALSFHFILVLSRFKIEWWKGPEGGDEVEANISLFINQRVQMTSFWLSQRQLGDIGAD
jgi:hypothetical protein